MGRFEDLGRRIRLPCHGLVYPVQIEVYRPNGVGDCLLLTPALREIRYLNPHAQIRVWGHPDAAYILMFLGLCDAIGDHRKGLRLDARPDVFIGWDWDERGLRIAAESFDIPHIAIAPFIAPAGVHQAEHYVNTVRRVFPLASTEMLRVACPIHDASYPVQADEEWEGAVLLHMSTTMREKRWPVERYYELAARLSSRGYKVAFVEGPGDNYGELAEAPVLTRPLLGQAWLAQRAALWIGNDTGPTHLAALMGCRTIALFGASNPVIWEPLGPRVRSLLRCERMSGREDHVWCRNHDCFRDMTVDLVEEEAIRMLEQSSLASVTG
jgi:heptosyltransferase-3